MIERIHASNPSRRAFTLIELLVVMAVISILVSLTAVGVVSLIASQGRNNTDAEIKAIYPILMQHWKAVIDDAKKENLWNDNDYPGGGPTLLSCADNDKERARILQIKLRLIEAFPVNFAELLPPVYAPTAPITGAECYAVSPPAATPTGFNPPLQLIPVKKRHYRGAYQQLVYDPTVNDLNNPGFCAPRWSAGGPIGTPPKTESESVQSAVCLLVALSTAKQGINIDVDQLKPYLKAVDVSGSPPPTPPDRANNPVLADAWGTPLRFYRFCTGNADLNAIAPPNIVNPGAVDPLDPSGKLLKWFTQGTQTTSQNATNFDKTIHLRTYGTSAAQYAIPVIVSAGPDAKFGLPAVDAATKTFVNTYSSIYQPTSQFPPTPPTYQDMSVQPGNGIKDETDNIYSFRKQGT